ncbi:hypothetical protein HC928_03180 [bacterium]|nr:hypothetical protein [bacterium]
MPITMGRKASAYRRRQNLYAKNVDAVQPRLAVQRLVHNLGATPLGVTQLTTCRPRRASR